MYRESAKFKINYNMARVEDGLYHGTLTIDRPNTNKGYHLPDFEKTEVFATVTDDGFLHFSKPINRHECIDYVLETIDAKKILPKREINNDPNSRYVKRIGSYSGTAVRSLDPNKWIAMGLESMTGIKGGYSGSKAPHE